MQLGGWGNIGHEMGTAGVRWTKFLAPERNLLVFSQHVAGWLSRGAWKLLQIDSSTGWMDPVQTGLFGGLLFGGEHSSALDQRPERAFLFEFDQAKRRNDDIELLIANLIFVLLLFGLHGYVVSSDDESGRILGIQDGFAYFGTREEECDISALASMFEAETVSPPQWVADIISERQELEINAHNLAS